MYTHGELPEVYIDHRGKIIPGKKLHIYEDVGDYPAETNVDQKSSNVNEGTFKKLQVRYKVLIIIVALVVVFVLANLTWSSAITFVLLKEGSWSGWSDWSLCLPFCGEGSQTRIRTCQNQLNNDCPGPQMETQRCYSHCPPGCNTSVYTKSNGVSVCAVHLTGNFTFHYAGLECEALNATLPEISSEKENEDVLSHMPFGMWKGIWLNLRDLKRDRKFTWINSGSIPSYTNWMEGEPNNYGKNEEYCVEMRSKSGEWNDIGCDWLIVMTMCEKEIKESEPTSD